MNEGSINLIAEGTRLEGEIHFSDVTRVHGTLVGKVHARPGSTLVLCETALVEGDIQADHLIIDGFVRGEIEATGAVKISSTGRVVGNIKTESLTIDFGAYFEGTCAMSQASIKPIAEPRA